MCDSVWFKRVCVYTRIAIRSYHISDKTHSSEKHSSAMYIHFGTESSTMNGQVEHYIIVIMYIHCHTFCIVCCYMLDTWSCSQCICCLYVLNARSHDRTGDVERESERVTSGVRFVYKHVRRYLRNESVHNKTHTCLTQIPERIYAAHRKASTVFARSSTLVLELFGVSFADNLFYRVPRTSACLSISARKYVVQFGVCVK